MPPHIKNIDIVPDGAWFDAPAERTPDFFPVYAKVSRALQEALRDAIPAHYFRDLTRYNDIEYAYPMLVYSASRVYRCRPSADFTPDVLNAAVMDKFYRLAHRGLKQVLLDTSATLVAAGLDAAKYDPGESKRIMRLSRAQKRFWRPLKNMLVAEGCLLQELMDLAECKNCPPNIRARKIAEFSKRWNSLLRRFYGRNDFTAVAPTLLSAATTALLLAKASTPTALTPKLSTPKDSKPVGQG